ncbi:MAG: hypothetical protein Q9217_000376 [Psora testacea]
MAPPVALHNQLVPNQALLSALTTSPHDFLQPYATLYAASLAQLKEFLDPLAAVISEAQQRRQQAARRKRKRGEKHSIDETTPLALKQVYLEGFDIDQIWEQARRILDASRGEVERSLSTILPTSTGDAKRSTVTNGHKHKQPAMRFRESDKDSLHVTSPRSTAGEDDERDLEDSEIDGLEDSVLIGGAKDSGDLKEHEELQDGTDGEERIGVSDEEKETAEVFVPDKLGLNDGFFSIDDFNRQSDFLEQQDLRGEGDGAASDEEVIEWDADPLTANKPQRVGKDLVEEGDQEDSLDEEDGPTFGNADLNDLELSDSGDASQPSVQIEDISIVHNTNDVKYADFFAPPPRKLTKSTRRRALPKTQPTPSNTALTEPLEEDIQRTISAVRRDIFEDDLTPDEASDSAPPDPSDRRSSHQKRQAKLVEEIRRLEAAAVAERDWTLSGEAAATDRPINSLLEEDLEFERAGKPIPVITQEVSEDIEALIKRRILAREFDEVIRRRPTNLVTGKGKDVRRGRFELEDGKPQQSLVEIYEAEHLKTIDPEGYVDKRDEKLKQEHAKIEALWRDVSAKLDALSSLHFRPKPPEVSISVVADVPTITMEDPRPAAGDDVAGESMLAPQEIYKPGEGRNKKLEVGTRSGLPVAREEMTREQKIRRRRREKERIRKAGGLGEKKDGQGKAVGKKAEEKKDVVRDLKKGGVRIIGRKGEIRDVEGNTVRGSGALGRGAGGYKL